MEVVPILPSPLAIIHYPHHEKLKPHVYNEIQEQRENQYTNSESDKLSHIDHYSVVEKEPFERFRLWVEQQAETFVRDVMGHYLQETMMVTDSWINQCDEGGYQMAHYHANSLISGLYYVNYTEDMSPTYFAKACGTHLHHPDSPSLNLNYEKNTRFNQIDQVVVKEGDVILWPSQIIHGFKKNNVHARTTLSMNLMPTIMSNGEYGWRVKKLSNSERMETVQHKEDGIIWDEPNLI